jgi:hypothetical protein
MPGWFLWATLIAAGWLLFAAFFTVAIGKAARVRLPESPRPA